MQLSNKKVEEVTKEINEIVNARKDSLVQKIYSSDPAVRRIYSPKRK